MDRSARHLAAAALSLFAATAAACGESDDDDPALETCSDAIQAFELTQPSGFVDLRPGAELELAWAVPAVTGITIDFELAEGNRTVALAPVLADTGTLRASADRDGTTFPMGVYHIRAGFSGCAESPSSRYDAGSLRLVFGRGVRFSDEAVTLSAAADPELDFKTVSLSTVEVELRLDPTPGGVAGDELILPRVSVPGELVEMERHLTFTGMTAGGDPIPYGVYRVTARLFAPPGDSYTEYPGPLLTWGA